MKDNIAWKILVLGIILLLIGVSIIPSIGGITIKKSITLSMVERNQSPVAYDDSYSLDEDGTLFISAPGILGNESDPIPIEASTFTSCAGDALSWDGNNFVTICRYVPDYDLYKPIGKGSYRKVSFFVKPDTTVTDTKTTSIIAIASYEYTKEKAATLILANNPFP